MGVLRFVFIVAMTPTVLCLLPKAIAMSAHLSRGADKLGEGGVSTGWVLEGMTIVPELMFCLVPTTLLGFVLAAIAELTAPTGGGGNIGR